MMERRCRIVLWAMMLLLSVVFFMKGHGPSQKEGPVAFFQDNSRPVMIRICGNIANPGVYTLQPDTDVGTVINMTLPGYGIEGVDNKPRNTVLHDGDVLELQPLDKQYIDISVKKMTAREMVVLGIPLDPNRLGADDWDYLPGIGPELAFRIVQDRQNNGDFRSVKDLQRVPGIGEAKIRQLAEYF
jgi:competence protein ComEA